MTLTIELQSEHGYVFLVALTIAIQCFFTGFAVMKHRTIFGSDEFQKRKQVQRLNDEHKAATGQPQIPKQGYPDMGSGRYSDALTYEEWYNLALAQRVHYNFVEIVAIAEVLLLVSGLFHPLYASIAGAGFIASRLLYTIGYLFKGPKGRIPGALSAELAMIIMLVLGVHGSLGLIGWL